MPFEELLDNDENIESEDNSFSGFDDESPFETFTEDELESAGVKLISSKDEELDDAPVFSLELKNAESESKKKDSDRINIASILDPSRYVGKPGPNKELFQELFEFKQELTEDDKKQLAFKDFFEAPKITGSLSGLAQSNIIPQDNIEKGEKKVYIEDEKLSDTEKVKPATVVLHKNEIGEIETIEVICSCGRTTAISLIYKDDDLSATIEGELHNHDDDMSTASQSEI